MVAEFCFKSYLWCRITMVSLSQCHSIIQCVAQCVIQKCTVEPVLCLHVCTSLVTMQSRQHVKSLSSWSLPGTAFGLACTLPQAWNAVLSIGGEKTLSRSCMILWKTLSLTSFFLSRNKGSTDISVIWVWIFEARHFVAEFVSHWFVIICVFVCVCVCARCENGFPGVSGRIFCLSEQFTEDFDILILSDCNDLTQWKRNSDRVAEAVGRCQPHLRKLPTSQQVERKAGSFLQKGQKSDPTWLTR